MQGEKSGLGIIWSSNYWTSLLMEGLEGRKYLLHPWDWWRLKIKGGGDNGVVPMILALKGGWNPASSWHISYRYTIVYSFTKHWSTIYYVLFFVPSAGDTQINNICPLSQRTSLPSRGDRQINKWQTTRWFLSENLGAAANKSSGGGG